MPSKSTSSVKKRRTEEQAIGELGQAQMMAFFRSQKWPCDEIGSDYGEDLLVRVFEDGISTGLSFYAQIKSTSDITRYKPKTNKLRRKHLPDSKAFVSALYYDVSVASLVHWEFSSPSVFLFVWDTTAQKGFWKPIPETIKKLDANQEGWRTAKSIRLHFRADYSCEASGLELLRLYLLKHNPHLVDKVMGENCQISFPNTPEGDAALKRFRHHLNYGGEITIDGTFFKTNEAEKRLKGPIAKWETTLTAGPVPGSKPIAMRLEVKNLNGEISLLPLVQMHLLEAANKQTVYVNGHPATPFSTEIVASPLHVTWSHLKEEGTQEWSISTKNSRPTVKQAQEALPFLQAFIQGGQFRANLLSQIEPKENWSHYPGYPLPQQHAARRGGVLDTEFEGWLDALAIIEKHFDLRFIIRDWFISHQDYWAIAEVIAAIEQGQSQQQFPRVPVGVEPGRTEAAQEEAKMIVAHHRSQLSSGGAKFQFSEEETKPLQILGQSIDVGPRTCQITGQIAVSPEELERVFAQSFNGKKVQFLLRAANAVTTYHSVPALR